VSGLRKELIRAVDGVALADVSCDDHRSPWGATEYGSSFALVFVRRGCFFRRVNGVVSLVDSSAVYFERPGDEYQVTHPRDGGDASTVLRLAEDAVVSLLGDARLPARPVFVTPEVDVAQRRLVALGAAFDASEFVERSLTIVATVLGEAVGRVMGGGRSQTQARRRRLVSDARLALHEQPNLELTELARQFAVSPYYLSRSFHLETGQTFSRLRNRLRVAFALERLAQGEESLTRLAADLGFADHAHLSRTVRGETGTTPSALRRLLPVEA
jgi:AraC-like DNA-binding protein